MNYLSKKAKKSLLNNNHPRKPPKKNIKKKGLYKRFYFEWIASFPPTDNQKLMRNPPLDQNSPGGSLTGW